MGNIAVKCDFCDNLAVWKGTPPNSVDVFLCEKHFRQRPVNASIVWTELNVAGPRRRCIWCNEIKPLSAFYRYYDRAGVERYRNECKECNLKRRRIRK